MQWEAQQSPQQVEDVKTLCKILDSVSHQVTSHPQIQKEVPNLVHREPGQQPFQTQLYYAGKGASPRPILNHQTNLQTRINGLGNLKFSVSFRNYEDSNPNATPGVYLDVFTKPWVHQKEWANAIRAAVQQSGASVSSDLDSRIDQLIANYKDRTVLVLERTKQQLQVRYPDLLSSMKVYTGKNHAGLRLLATKDLLGTPIDPQRLQETYGQLLKDTLIAYFQSNPEEPLTRLIADAILPGWGLK